MAKIRIGLTGIGGLLLDCEGRSSVVFPNGRTASKRLGIRDHIVWILVAKTGFIEDMTGRSREQTWAEDGQEYVILEIDDMSLSVAGHDTSQAVTAISGNPGKEMPSGDECSWVNWITSLTDFWPEAAQTPYRNDVFAPDSAGGTVNAQIEIAGGVLSSGWVQLAAWHFKPQGGSSRDVTYTQPAVAHEIVWTFETGEREITIQGRSFGSADSTPLLRLKTDPNVPLKIMIGNTPMSEILPDPKAQSGECLDRDYKLYYELFVSGPSPAILPHWDEKAAAAPYCGAVAERPGTLGCAPLRIPCPNSLRNRE